MTLIDRLRLFLARWVLSPLQGIAFGDWMRALRDNRFAIHPVFWPRALLTTLSSLLTSLQARRERHRYGPRVAATQVVAPIFILGHYRSGTTHLHNLLGHDPRFGFANNFQANQPHTFLTTERIGTRLGAALTMRRRPHDNVQLDLNVPTEDELALCADTLLSPHMAWHFPRRAAAYSDRYLTFAEATTEERHRWCDSLRTFARKLTLKQGRRLVFKSPLHTARIPLLLEAFPDAVFVHVHRDPYLVFQSTRNMELKVEPLFRYQRSRLDALDERILHRYRALYAAYLRDRQLVPGGRLAEISFAELDSDPLPTLARLYEALDLPPFEAARPAIEAYLESIRDYRKNVYPPLDTTTRTRVAERWQACFLAWSYPIHAARAANLDAAPPSGRGRALL